MIQQLNEDCLVGMKNIPDNSIDMVIADPPYGVTRLEYDHVVDMEAFFTEILRITKPDAAILVFGVEPFSSKIRMANAKIYRYDWIWDKSVCTGFLNAHKMPLRSYEVISVFYRKLPTYNPQMTKTDKFSHRLRHVGSHTNHYREFNTDYGCLDTGQRFPKSIIKISNNHGNTLSKSERDFIRHPSSKPKELFRYLIRTYSNPGNIILDPFMGGGFAAIAAAEEDRNYIGFEIDTQYFDMAVTNYETYTRRKQASDTPPPSMEGGVREPGGVKEK